MVYEAYQSIFDPPLGMVVGSNLHFRLGQRLQMSVWRFRSIKVVLAVLAGLWAPFALDNAHRWGVGTSLLDSIRATRVSIQIQIPLLNLLRLRVFLFLVVALVVYFFIFKPGGGMGY